MSRIRQTYLDNILLTVLDVYFYAIVVKQNINKIRINIYNMNTKVFKF